MSRFTKKKKKTSVCPLTHLSFGDKETEKHGCMPWILIWTRCVSTMLNLLSN